jgi:tape measure domain-containing protein
MAKVKTLSIEVDLRDKGAQAVIEKIGGSIKRLQVISGPTSQTIQKLRQQVTQLGQKGNNSISTIEGQIGALRGLRREADLNSKEFKELTADIDKYTQKLKKAQGQKKKGGLGARATTQIAGAVVSGGIFGGPEGALGAAGGAIFGGVQGAFAGAAIGAQMGMLRKQLGEFASYAAQLEKLRISLRGITGTQEAYTQALSASTKVTNDFNIPQDVAIRGMTRLTAAVKGAGGNITDTELAFRNINAAIIATGGDALQAEGAITALVQIFSKGKVSAEEINQIAERLPGAFTKIADASGRTGPQLTKDLQDGKVGLNDLMLFLRQLGVDYEELALKIAASDESAGARLGVVYDDLREQLGSALKPIGAELQNALNDFIKKNGPDLVNTAKQIGEALMFIVKNRGAIKTVAEIAAKLLLVNLAIKGLIALKGPARLTLQMLQVQFGTTAARARLANKQLLAVKSTLGSLALIGLVTVGVDIAITGFAKLQSTLKQIRELKNRTEGGAAARFAGETREGGIRRVSTAKATEAAILREQADRESLSGKALGAARTLTGGFLGPFIPALNQQADAGRNKLLETRLKEARENAALPIPAAVKKPELTEFKDPFNEEDKEDKDKGGAKSARSKDISELRKQLEFTKILVGRNKDNFALREKMLFVQRAAAVRASEELDANKQEVAVLRASEEFRKGMLQIDEDRKKAREKAAEAADKEAEAERKLLDARMQLRDQLGLLSPEERVKAAQDSFIQDNPKATPKDLDLIRQSIDPTLFEQGTARIREMREELAQLVNPINVVANAGAAIGTAFTDSFRSVIDGSATTQEALASFFKNIGNFFMDMAAQIIQKMITMYILNTFVGLLPGGGGGGLQKGAGLFKSGLGFGGFGAAPAGLNTSINLAGNGAYFSNGIAKFARGGIVNKPTMFAYADGGAGRFGIMGEAGPEAILPLRRGPGGKLGVESSGGGVKVGTININVENTGENLSPAAQKQIANQVRGIVIGTLADERRSGGML